MSDYMLVALEAVKKAEAVILHYWEDGVRAKLKPDQSPVTLADIEAEKVILEYLRSNFPDHSFLGEESGEDVHNQDFLWVVDPIDGTKNFLRKLPLFATQLALFRKGELVLGVSNAPILKELIYAEKGKGAMMNDKALQVSKLSKLSEAYMSFGGIHYFQQTKQLDKLLALHEKTRGHRGIGDFWSYHLLAQGKIDLMLEAKTKIWDIAACALIVEEAGGRVTELSGKPISLESTSILASNGLLHEEVQEVFLS